ncbi:(deoxy)nucleoside triphosphate pyrophosphohydrolase [Marinicrinis sediminis]|uniref:8-oxo-dGTP diphosphatase n=1 Tax=Marinicrinis sediminis TaxID=1652465 RepID=A0ABW5R860_9BACL
MIDVAAAIVTNEQGDVLIARRKAGKAQGGLWEFPGGKIEQGESVEACLKRELLEEMNIQIEPVAFFGMQKHAEGDTAIRLIAYTAKYIAGEIELVDHDACDWVEPIALTHYLFAPADRPFVSALAASQSRLPEA